MYNAHDTNKALSLLKQNYIAYIEVPRTSPPNIIINYAFYNTFPIVFTGANFTVVKVP